MSQTRVAPLSDLIETIAQGIPTQRYEVADDQPGEAYPLIQARQMDNLYVHADLPTVRLTGERLDRFQLAAGTVLVAIRTWPIKASVLSPDVTGAIAGQNIATLTLKPTLLPMYLAGLLRSDWIAQRITVRQAASGQPMLSLKELQAVEIPMPPLVTQQGLADLFLGREQADHLARQIIQQRQRVVEAALHRCLRP